MHRTTTKKYKNINKDQIQLANNSAIKHHGGAGGLTSVKKGKNNDPTGTAMKQKQCLFEYGEGMENINNGIGSYKGPSHIQNIKKAYDVSANRTNE